MKASILWPGIIVGILGANVGIVGLTVAVSRAGGGYVVEKGYDQKALKWDEHKARLEKQAQLGWGVSCDVAQATSGEGLLQVRVKDRDGKPVTNARVRVSAFQAGWPREAKATAVVLTDGDGVAMCAFEPLREGTWVMDVSVSRGADVHEVRMQRDVWFDVAAPVEVLRKE